MRSGSQGPQSHSQGRRLDLTPAADASNPTLQASFLAQTFQETEHHCSSEKHKVIAYGQVLGPLLPMWGKKTHLMLKVPCKAASCPPAKGAKEASFRVELSQVRNSEEATDHTFSHGGVSPQVPGACCERESPTACSLLTLNRLDRSTAGRQKTSRGWERSPQDRSRL